MRSTQPLSQEPINLRSMHEYKTLKISKTNYNTQNYKIIIEKKSSL